MIRGEDEKPTLGVYGPKLPEKSGVAQYIADSLLYLQDYFDCCHISNRDYVAPTEFACVLYHLGNNVLHHCAFAALRERPGPVLLHEYNNLDYYYSCWELLPDEEKETLLRIIGQVLREKFTSREEIESYFTANPHVDRYSLNAGCEQIAMQQSSLTLVHSRYIATHLSQLYPQIKIKHIRLPVKQIIVDNSQQTRIKFSFPQDYFVFGVFGFLGEYKRIEKVVEAWCTWDSRPSNAVLLFVGERQYDVHIPQIPSIIELGYVSDSDFDSLLLSVDCSIQLRYPSLGETSGAISRLVAHGAKVIISDIPEMQDYRLYAKVQFIPVGDSEVSSLQAAMQNSYHEGRNSLCFREEFEWQTWIKQMVPLLSRQVYTN